MKKIIILLIIISCLSCEANPKKDTTEEEVLEYLDDNIISYWTMDEIEGDVLKDTKGDNDGFIKGDAEAQDGVVKDSLYFNGTNSYVSIPNSSSLDIKDELSISVWIKTEEVAKTAMIYCNQSQIAPINGYSLGLNDSGKIELSSQVKKTVSDEILNTEDWFFVVATLEDGVGKIYINGDIDATADMEFASSNDVDQTIGATYFPGLWYKGNIDEMIIYDKCLSEEEVKTLYAIYE